MSAAGKAKQGTTDEATNAFLRVQNEITQFGAPPPRKDTLGGSDHRKSLADPSTALANAAQKDEKTTTFLSKIKSVFKAPVSCQSYSGSPTVHNAEPGTQGTRKESKLRDSSITA